MRTGPNFAAVHDMSLTVPMGAGANGRIDLLSTPPSLQVPNYQQQSYHTANNDNFAAEATNGQIARTPLTDLFFSPQNVDALQSGLRYRIYQETGGKQVIGRQSDTELKVIMRSIFYQYAKHQPCDIVGQVRELNGKVLAWTVPEVLSNLKQHIAYRRDASTLPLPMEHAQLMTSKGAKILELPKFM